MASCRMVLSAFAVEFRKVGELLVIVFAFGWECVTGVEVSVGKIRPYLCAMVASLELRIGESFVHGVPLKDTFDEPCTLDNLAPPVHVRADNLVDLARGADCALCGVPRNVLGSVRVNRGHFQRGHPVNGPGHLRAVIAPLASAVTRFGAAADLVGELRHVT